MCGCIGVLLILGSFIYLVRGILLGEPMSTTTTLLALAFVTVGVIGLVPRLRR